MNTFRINIFYQSFLKCIIILLFISSRLISQETNSHASGRVLSEMNSALSGATVTAIHEPTQSKYVTVSHINGNFNFFNLTPGGPYTIIISSSGFKNLKTENLIVHFKNEHFSLGNTEATAFILEKSIVTLNEVVVKSNSITNNKTGIETSITSSTLQSMPTISRSFQDFLRIIPQAKVTGDGVISLAGQNNRFNSFFIDGANNNDILGLAANGTNGGLTGSPPVSIEAIEEIKVLLSPYDVQYGNFTGGSINAITRSGSNENKSSAWYYFRNQNLAGRSPKPIENPRAPGTFDRPRLSNFINQTFGAWNSGAFIKNKLFYFALLEKQADVKPQPFNISEYKGNTNQQQLLALSDFLKSTYQYDPGSFLETRDELNATRLILKFDWNASIRNKLMLAYRYNNAERTTPRIQSSATTVLFRNNGIILPARTHTASFEWKSFFKNGMNNRLLFTYTNQLDDRKWIGDPFPGVSIQDGTGTIILGSDAASGAQGFKGNDVTLFDAFKFIKKNHVLTLGVDINYSKLEHTVIPNYFGLYQYRNLGDFINGAYPARFIRSFPPTNNAVVTNDYTMSKFTTFRSSAFINDEIKVGLNLKVNMGLRLDVNSVFSKGKEDNFFTDTAIRIISKYYDLEGAVSGEIRTQWMLSPRIGFNYKLPKHQLTFRGGAGIFAGHGINVWLSNLVGDRFGSIDINPQQYGLNFNSNPYNQPSPGSLNINTDNLKGDPNLLAKDFKYPSVFRASLAADKKLNNWLFSIEAIQTKNIHETVFRNVNILPPVRISASPDSRNIYSLNTAPDKIPLRSNGTNPYSNIFLVTNNNGKKGSAYSISFIINKQIKTLSLNSSYTYGSSKLLFEITGPQTPIAAQWRNMETVNGRNFTTLSTSDNDMQHRITTWISKQINYAKNAAATISIFYNGQSGSPYSYVYSGSIVNDNGNREIFDLIYIPTATDLTLMNFTPLAIGGITYTPQQQKNLLNEFIQNDKYLNKHRGEFAERNGARLPFTHIVDVRIQHDFKIRLKNKNVGLSITYDVFNFTNMLNKEWGNIYFLSNDAYPLITFAGYANTATLTPQYQHRPVNGKPYSLQTSTAPGNSARWISQLGLKMNLN